MKHPLLVTSLLATTSLLAACAPKATAPDPLQASSSSAAAVSSASVSSNPNVVLTSPQPNSVVTSPLTLTGEAAGWYFEASFPVKLLDGNGNLLAQGPATASGDWMTTDFVPFTATLTFATPATTTGTLVLEKDNPSGEPQYAQSVSIPVQF